MEFKVIKTGSAGNAYLLTEKKESILIDCGATPQSILSHIPSDCSLVGVLLTHSHGDHSKYVKKYLDCGFKVFSGKETWQTLGIHNSYAMSVKPIEPFNVRSFALIPVPVEHDVPCMSWVINRNTLFVTDAVYSKYKIDTIKNVIIEINYDQETIENNCDDSFYVERVKRTHLSLENATEYIRRLNCAKIENIIAIHTSERNANRCKIIEILQRDFPFAKVSIATNGAEYSFGNNRA